MDYHFDSIHHCVIIESNVLHQFESHLERLFCIIILFSLVENSGNQNPMLSATYATSESPPIAL